MHPEIGRGMGKQRIQSLSMGLWVVICPLFVLYIDMLVTLCIYCIGFFYYSPLSQCWRISTDPSKWTQGTWSCVYKSMCILCACMNTYLIHIRFCMGDIRFVLSRWAMCCGSEGQRGTGGWFDVVEGEVGEVGSRGWALELESWKVMFINCYQCAGA